MKEKFYGRKIIVAVFILMFAAYGCISTSAIYFPEFVTATGSDISKIAIMSSTYGVGCVIAGFFADKVMDKIGLKWSAMIGVLLIGLHHFLYSMTHSVIGLYIEAALGGVGYALGTMTCCAAIVQKWYVKDREKMIGYAFAGTGVGAAFWTLLAGQMITKYGYAISYRIEVVLVLLLCIPAILFVIKMPEDLGVKAYGAGEADVLDNTDTPAEVEGPEAKEIYKTPSFIIMLIGLVAVGFLNLNFESYTPAYWQENGVTVAATSAYFAAYYLLGSILTAFAGVIAQKFGAIVYTIYLCVVFILGVVAVLIWGYSFSIVFILLCVLFMSASFALYSSVPGTVTTEAYGSRSYTRICALLTAAYSVGQLIGPLQFSYTLDATGSYTTAYISLIIVGVIALVAVVVGLLTAPMRKARKQR